MGGGGIGASFVPGLHKNICRNIESTVRLIAKDFIIYWKIMNNSDIEILRVDLDRLGEWVVENAMNINPVASKVVSFTRGRVKDSLNYFLEGPKNSGSERLQIYKNNHTLD